MTYQLNTYAFDMDYDEWVAMADGAAKEAKLVELQANAQALWNQIIEHEQDIQLQAHVVTELYRVFYASLCKNRKDEHMQNLTRAAIDKAVACQHDKAVYDMDPAVILHQAVLYAEGDVYPKNPAAAKEKAQTYLNALKNYVRIQPGADLKYEDAINYLKSKNHSELLPQGAENAIMDPTQAITDTPRQAGMPRGSKKFNVISATVGLGIAGAGGYFAVSAAALLIAGTAATGGLLGIAAIGVVALAAGLAIAASSVKQLVKRFRRHRAKKHEMANANEAEVETLLTENNEPRETVQNTHQHAPVSVQAARAAAQPLVEIKSMNDRMVERYIEIRREIAIASNDPAQRNQAVKAVFARATQMLSHQQFDAAIAELQTAKNLDRSEEVEKQVNGWSTQLRLMSNDPSFNQAAEAMLNQEIYQQAHAAS